MKQTHLFFYVICLSFLMACNTQKEQVFYPDHADIRYSGRVDLQNPKIPELAGSASFVELAFTGDSCAVLLKKCNPAGEHNFISFELDGEYQGRIKLDSDTMRTYIIRADSSAASHVLRIVKETEAANGNVAFGGVKCLSLSALPEMPKRKIEFIGNSITCGMGIAWREIPCDSGLWYDQHNAYWAYGSRVARSLDAQYMLSSVSGIGMYRNWNDVGPIMPEVYQQVNLSKEGASWDFNRFTPDLVSIALGTNDFSDGDGVHERLPFDSAAYVQHYIDFVEVIYAKYPNPQLCLLTSPMVSGEKGVKFLNCLEAVQQYFKKSSPDKKEIAIYNFTAVEPHGCGYHPDKDDHARMAQMLILFYKDVMGW